VREILSVTPAYSSDKSYGLSSRTDCAQARWWTDPEAVEAHIAVNDVRYASMTRPFASSTAARLLTSMTLFPER
jgi:hypothetical protein